MLIGQSGPGSLILSDGAHLRSRANLNAGIGAQGSLLVLSASRADVNLTQIGSGTVSGTLSVRGAGSTFISDNDVNVVRGVVSVFDNGRLGTLAQDVTLLADGLLQGDALIASDVVCQGTIDPSHLDPSSTGAVLTIDGALNMRRSRAATSSKNGTLILNVFDLVSNNDQLFITDRVRLAGSLIVPELPSGQLLSGELGQSVELITALGGLSFTNGVLDAFDVVSLPPLADPSLALKLRYVCPGCEGGSGVRLEVGRLGEPINFVPAPFRALSQEPAAVIAADLNLRRTLPPQGDQLSDLVVVESGGPNTPGAVRLITNRGNDSLGNWLGFQPQSQLVSVGNNPVAVHKFDIDNDGDEDLFVANAGSNTVSVLRNQTTPGAQTPAFDTAAVLQTGRNPVDVEVGPFASDGRSVVISLDRDDRTLSIFVADAPFVFRPRIIRPAPSPATPRPADRIRCGDFNADGRLDLAVLSTSERKVWLFRNTTTAADEPGTVRFADAVEYSVGAEPVDIIIAKLRNGFPSVVTANRGDNSLSVLINANGPGGVTQFGLQPAVNISAGMQPTSLAVADLEGDGDDDLVVVTNVLATTDPIRARIFRNDFVTDTPSSPADQVVLIRDSDIVDPAQLGDLKFVVPANLSNPAPSPNLSAPDLVTIHRPGGGRGPGGGPGNITPVLRPRPCPADFDLDGLVTPDDLADFINTYFAGSLFADFDHSGSLDPDDLADYISAYFAGCR